MPRVRCKFYEEDGTPVNGGCRKIGFCDFIHPSDPLWANSPAPKSRTTTQRIGGDGGGGKNFNKRRESGSGWQQSSEQGGPPATGTNSWGNPGTGWGSRAGGNGGGGRKASKEELSTWRNSTADSSSTENTWGNVSWADPSAADSSSWENFSWGNPAASTSKSSAWESSEKGKEVDRSGNSGWDNAGAWGDSPWGNGGSGWGDTTVTSGWGSWGDTSATPGWGTGDSSAAADREEPEPPTANPGTPTEPKAMRERTRISSPDKEGWGTFQEPRATTEEAMDSDTPSNAQPGNESWGSSNTTVKGESSVPTPADSAQSTAWAIAALASEPSPAARLEREDGKMDLESPATGNANGEAMEVDDWEPQVKSHLSPSPPPPPPADVHRPNTPPTQTPVSSSSLTRKRARSPSEPKDSEVYTRSDYVKALIESTLCQYQYDQAQALQAKDKALRHSKAYHNAGPRAIERLTQLGAEHAAEHAQAQKRRNAAAKRLVSISEYYHDSSALPLDWVHAEDADPVDFVSRSIEDVKAWVNKAAELVKVPAALSGVQHSLDSSSSMYSTATAAVTLGLTSRLAKMEKRVEDQYSYLSQLQEDSEQMLDQSLEERWTFMSSVHTKTKEHLRTCRESKANINAELMKLNQDMVVVKEMHRHLAEERAQVLKEHHCLDTRIVELEQNDIIRNEAMRRNTEEIERIKAGFREAEEARKRAPDPVDPTIVAYLLRPTVEQIVHEEIKNISSTLVDGVSSSLAVYQKQTAEAVWTHLHPILRLNSEIHKIANEHRSRVPETRAAVFDVEPQALR